MRTVSTANAPGWRRGGAAGALIAAILVIVAALAVPPSASRRAAVRAHGPDGGAVRIDRPAPPAVEPLELAPVAPSDAVTINAAVPFVGGPRPAARPYRFVGSPEERLRAEDCLASAMLYEAGTEGDDGQRAVAQVVLNRVRHPAFPASVCGVVFQGAERRTGCQFTFTCDGALRRVPSADAWRRARLLARTMLEGRVFAPVGLATHYHTNWVVPYWSETLDKLAGVGTHLFFRWRGWWGTPGAFGRGRPGDEPVVPRLAFLSEAHRGEDPLPSAEGDPNAAVVAEVATRLGRPPILADAATPGREPRLAADVRPPTLLSPGEDSFIFLLNAASPDGFPAVARRACEGKAYCKVQGWTDRTQVPSGYPVPPDRLASMAFSYLRDPDSGFDRMLWNCRQFPRQDPLECMRT